MLKRSAKVKIFLIVLVLTLTMPLSIKAFAELPEEVKQKLSNAIVLYEDGTRAYVNGAETSIGPADSYFKPETINGRVFVPLRFIAEGLGAKVNWDKKRAAIIESKDKIIGLKVGSKKFTVDGKEKFMDVAPKWGAFDDNSIYVPVRAIAQTLGKNLFYQDGLIIISDSKDLNFQKPVFNKILSNLGAPGLYTLDLGSDDQLKFINKGEYFDIAKIDNEWVYISDFNNLYKVNVNTLEKNVVIPSGIRIASKVIVENGWVYYSNASDGNKIYKVNLNDGIKTRLNHEDSGIIEIVDGYLYYYYNEFEDSGKISRIKTDGSDKRQLTKNRSMFEGVVDGWLYYDKMDYEGCGGSDCFPGKLHRVELDGSQNQELADSRGQFQSVEKDKIYFMLGDVIGQICEMERDGKNIKVIVDKAIPNFYKANAWIYYSGNNGITRVTVDGMKEEKIMEGNAASIIYGITNEWLYYGTMNGLNMSSLDGKNIRKLLDESSLVSKGLYVDSIEISEDKIFIKLYSQRNNKVNR